MPSESAAQRQEREVRNRLNEALGLASRHKVGDPPYMDRLLALIDKCGLMVVLK